MNVPGEKGGVPTSSVLYILSRPKRWQNSSKHLFLYGNDAGLKTIVNEWFANFENGIQDLEYDFSGRSSEVDDDSLKAPLNEDYR